MWFIQLDKIAYDEHLTLNAELMLFVCLGFYARRYHKSQAIYLESKDNTKISCVISSVGTNEVSFSTHPAAVAVRNCQDDDVDLLYSPLLSANHMRRAMNTVALGVCVSS